MRGPRAAASDPRHNAAQMSSISPSGRFARADRLRGDIAAYHRVPTADTEIGIALSTDPVAPDDEVSWETHVRRRR